MEHELIDFYDENGKHLGIIDKSVAHGTGLWHKSVHVWIMNDKNQILLQKRCAQKKFFPSFWDCSFAGHIGAGESSLVSAIREGQEELGLTINPQELKYLFTIKEEFVWNDITSREFVDVFVMQKNINLNNLNYQTEEVETAKFFDMKKVFSKSKPSNILPHDEEFKILESILCPQKEESICSKTSL